MGNSIVDAFEECYIGLDEFNVCARVEAFEFGDELGCCFLRSAYEVDAWTCCVAHEFTSCGLSNPCRAADYDVVTIYSSWRLSIETYQRRRRGQSRIDSDP